MEQSAEAYFLDAINDLFVAFDHSEALISHNRVAREVTGYAQSELESMQFAELFPDEETGRVRAAIGDATETGSATVSVPLSAADATTPAYEFTIRQLPESAPAAFAGVGRDITEQRRQREQLETEERVLREMYEIIAARDRSFAEKVDDLLQLGRSELETEYASLSRIEGEEYTFEYVDAANGDIQQGDTTSLSATNCEITAGNEQTLVLGDVKRDAPSETDRKGYEEWGISCYIGAPVFSGDEVYGTFCFYGTNTRSEQFLDWQVTFVELMSRWVSYELERDQINSRLEEKNERLEQFASVLSHDIRNPLTVALGRLDIVRQEHTSEHFDVIEQSLVRIESLIEDVLIHVRQEESLTDTEDVELGAITDQCWSVVDTEAATLDVESELTFTANPARLQRLLENLLRNAIEHGSTDATIRVGALSDASGFYLADDGPGIPEENRTDVFESGYSETSQGTGFGLAIVQGVADAHGWDIAITESDSGGARFEISGVETIE